LWSKFGSFFPKDYGHTVSGHLVFTHIYFFLIKRFDFTQNSKHGISNNSLVLILSVVFSVLLPVYCPDKEQVTKKCSDQQKQRLRQLRRLSSCFTWHTGTEKYLLFEDMHVRWPVIPGYTW